MTVRNGGRKDGHGRAGGFSRRGFLEAALFAFAAVGVGLAMGAPDAHAETVRIGTEGAYAPFNYTTDDGKLAGFDIDIANALCAEMKVECSFVAQDWDGIIPALIAGRYDAIIASMSITPDREEVVLFTDPYYRSPAAFLTLEEGGVTDTSPAALADKTIGVQAAATHAKYVEDKHPDSDQKQYRTLDDAVLDLQSGRVDVVMGDKLALHDWANDKAKGLKFVGEDITAVEYFGPGIGIALRKEDAALKDKFNAALKAIIADGTYEKINAKYFPFSIR
ncbi:lysine/arginine/ornithine ABC transporter substrate-binding protein [Marinibaculum pumilum]|uniref:Lysine/arginine/ornithine ABC transporter substrate-binding protein n=1 Tax=Marinibaculum pumilum TaxID=1766165 RepID=A0ABV7L841_9PROT